MLPNQFPNESRRDFLAASAGVAAASMLIPHVHAAGAEVIRVGLIGCGGRGTGAASQALRADPHAKLVAMGDMFPDRLEGALKTIKNDDEIGKKVDVKQEKRFTGWDAYKQVIASGVDVVLLTTPPAFRPMHLAAAVEAGKHVFCEKPVAVDAPGVRSVLATCRKAKKKKLAIVSGLCWRYDPNKREIMKRIHAGDIGRITALHCIYHAGALWHTPREPNWDDMTYQLRNWPYFTWLSGDHIVEQAIHSIDKMSWAMKDEPPVKATGLGGRQSRTGPEFGHIFDHHAVVYEYKDGVKMFHSCRQQKGTKQETSDFVYGTEGAAKILSQRDHIITGKKPYTENRRLGDMYQIEHDELFASIRSGKFINDGERMAQSTLLAIMGRMATYTGQEITWKMAQESVEDLSPKKYEFGHLPVAPVAKPGVTKFS